MFKIEGEIDVTVVEAYAAEPKFPTGMNDRDPQGNNRGEAIVVWGDIVLVVQDKNGNNDRWFGEISNRNGAGNSAHLTRTELTIKTLQEIGFGVQDWNQLYAQIVDDGSLPNLVGKEATAVVERRTYKDRNGQEREAYYIKYLNARGGSVRRMSKAMLQDSFQKGGFHKDAENHQTAYQQPPAAPAPAPTPAPAPVPAPAPTAPQGYAAAPAAPAAPTVPAVPASPACPY